MFRVRTLSPTGDYTFGQGGENFLIDSPAAVGQAAGTRLKLWAGEWWLDLSSGTEWWQEILAHKDTALASTVIRERILGTPFANSIDNYSCVFNPNTRVFSVTGMLNTAFGQIPINFPSIAIPGIFEVGGSPLGAGGGGLGP